MSEGPNCPRCKRRMIIENERYCQFCEQEASNVHHDEYVNFKFPKKLKGIAKAAKEKISESFGRIKAKIGRKSH